MINTSVIHNRMKSIRQTVQISSAQKMIAASRIGKARHMLQDTAPYHDRIRQAIAGLLEMSPDISSRYLLSDKPSLRRGMLVITSDRGLAGGYNNNIIKCVEETVLEQPVETMFVLGQVGRNHLEQAGHPLAPMMIEPPDAPTLYFAREIAEHIMDWFERKEFECFDVVYTHYTSTVRLAPVVVRILPLQASMFGEAKKPLTEIAFEPSAEEVLSSLIPKYLKGFLYGCLVHSWASELASRIMAMDSAIRNGNEMLDQLSLLFNRARQASITQEITEIVAGAASMKKKNHFMMPPKRGNMIDHPITLHESLVSPWPQESDA